MDPRPSRRLRHVQRHVDIVVADLLVATGQVRRRLEDRRHLAAAVGRQPVLDVDTVRSAVVVAVEAANDHPRVVGLGRLRPIGSRATAGVTPVAETVQGLISSAADSVSPAAAAVVRTNMRLPRVRCSTLARGGGGDGTDTRILPVASTYCGRRVTLSHSRDAGSQCWE